MLHYSEAIPQTYKGFLEIHWIERMKKKKGDLMPYPTSSAYSNIY